MEPLPARFELEALHARLCQRITALRPAIVGQVMQTFLEVSSLPCERRLWSLEFAFDEDDGRVARIEARFAEPGISDPTNGVLRGYEVELLLPRLIPARGPASREPVAGYALAMAASDGTLVSRFLRGLADLGAYRTIEPLEALSVEPLLL